MKREFYSLSVTGLKSILLFLPLLLTGILSKAQTTTIEKTTVSGCYYYSG
ncbi:MAG: hypothetical protein JNM44_06070, partial [Chitinophagaceae bacterium]|nr:hypothetical protein [Chitinophagaceae bacterium]